MKATAVVTGIGVAAPNGLRTEEFWASTCAGLSGIDTVSRFDPASYPSRLAGQVRGFDAKEHLPSRLLPQTDHMTQMGLAVADWALADSGVDTSTLPEYGMGVVTAASAGGYEFGQTELEKLWSRGPRHVSAYQSFAWFYAVNTGQISIRNKMRGPCQTLVSDQAGGLDAIGQARRRVRGGVPLVMTGGVDGSICPWGWLGHLSSGRVSTAEAPERAFLPFDAAAGGHVVGEGGAHLVVEEAGAAQARGARPYGRIAGYSATFDPAPGSGLPSALPRAIEQALSDAGKAPEEVGAVFADAAAVPELDRAEAEAISGVFGPGGVPVTAPKTMTGRLHAGGGPLDVATALLALRDGVIPPTVNTELSSSYDIDLVSGEARESAELDTVLVLARGQGGFNSAMVLCAS
uniref:Ketosynthase chain-length factor n=1 Tax=Nocardiopsis sp. TaxID=310350 RepID=A0A7M1C9F1_9ACTN|nr:ketosynthase chain-length factor [Nocardiopsis sp.]